MSEDIEELFPRFEMTEVQAALAEHWDLSRALPVPREHLRACPSCGTEGAIPRRWRFHERDTSDRGWRCDVSMKCIGCGRHWGHGLPVREEVYERWAGAVVERREAERILQMEVEE